jgi:curved DNA-binding protein CbpA
VNIFIQIMGKDNDVSITKLKQIYRVLSKKLHPDVHDGNQESFIRLKREYEEAYKLIKELPNKARNVRSKNEARIELLKELYLFSLRMNSPKLFRIEEQFAKIVKYAQQYDLHVMTLLNKYHKEILGDLSQKDEKTKRANEMLMESIKHLFSYYWNKVEIEKRIFIGDRHVLERRVKELDDRTKKIFIMFFNWLEDELENEPVQYSVKFK